MNVLGPQGDRADAGLRLAHVLRRVARPERRRVRHLGLLGGAARDLERGDRVRPEREVRAVLLAGADRHQDDVRALLEPGDVGWGEVEQAVGEGAGVIRHGRAPREGSGIGRRPARRSRRRPRGRRPASKGMSGRSASRSASTNARSASGSQRSPPSASASEKPARRDDHADGPARLVQALGDHAGRARSPRRSRAERAWPPGCGSRSCGRGSARAARRAGPG